MKKNYPDVAKIHPFVIGFRLFFSLFLMLLHIKALGLHRLAYQPDFDNFQLPYRAIPAEMTVENA